MKHIFLINGPPGSGKDYLADKLVDNFSNAVKRKMAEPISKALKSTFGFTDEVWKIKRESTKEKPIFGSGLTVRKTMIEFSESFLKPNFGEDIFARLLFNDALKLFVNDVDYIFVSDCGFQQEHDYIVEKCKQYSINCFLIRATRFGKSFKGDSREFVLKNKNQKMFVWNNQETLEDLNEVIDWADCISS